MSYQFDDADEREPLELPDTRIHQPEPCIGCEHHNACATRLLGCSDFSSYLERAKWPVGTVRRPDRATFRRIYNEPAAPAAVAAVTRYAAARVAQLTVAPRPDVRRTSSTLTVKAALRRAALVRKAWL